MKLKNFLSVLLFTICGYHSYSQSLAINTDGSIANTSALLDVKSTLKGVLIPRMSRTERNAITTPVVGLMIFQNAPDSIGFYYYNGSAWTWMLANSNSDSLAWRTGGNSGTVDGTNFIGTKDNIPFNIRVNNQKAGRIDHIGWNSFYGYQAGNVNSSGIHNTAIGYQALLSNLGGTNNTAIGTLAANSNTTGDQNTATGYGSLYLNTVGQNNTAVGFYAMFNNVAGSNGTAFGNQAMLYSNNTTTPFTNWNSAFGYEALKGSTTASANTGNFNNAFGYQSLWNNSTGGSNTALGATALFSNTAGGGNTAVGNGALYLNAGGDQNTAIGVNALQASTSGLQNTALGVNSLYTNATGNFNTANGYSTLYYNVTGSNATAIGYQAMQYANNSATPFINNNVAVGYESLRGNAPASGNTGLNNTALGYQSLFNNSAGSNNTATGLFALNQNTTASRNTAIGSNALFTQSFSNGGTAWSSENIAIGDSVLYANQPTTNSNGYQNTAIGNRSLRNNTIGWQNTALGTFSMFSNTIGQLNTANGWASLYQNTDGYYNTALGAMAMYYNTTGGYNVGVGTVSLHHNVTGTGNTAVGQQAGLGTVGNSFSYNTIVGYQSGYSLTTGSNNVFIGNQAGYNVTSASNKLYIANSSTNPPLIYGNFATGYLGLGTISPSAKLHVGGGTRFTVLDTGSIFLQSGNTIGSARDWKMAVSLPNGYLTFRDMGFDNLNNGMASDAMVIQWGTGNVGIGATAPSSKLEVNGYTKLGSGGTVPAIQMKKLTGTSPASAGGTVLISHGLDWTKILAVDVLLDNSPSLLPPRYDNSVVDYSFHVTSTDIVIYNGVSVAFFNRPVRILITYEQ